MAVLQPQNILPRTLHQQNIAADIAIVTIRTMMTMTHPAVQIIVPAIIPGTTPAATIPVITPAATIPVITPAAIPEITPAATIPGITPATTNKLFTKLRGYGFFKPYPLFLCYFLFLELKINDAKKENTNEPLIPTADAVKPPVKSPKNP